MITLFKRKKYIWLSELQDYKDSDQEGFYLEMVFYSKKIHFEILLGLLGRLKSIDSLHFTNYLVDHDEIESEIEKDFDQVYSSKDNYRLMTLFSKTPLGKGEFDSVKEKWKNGDYDLPNNGEIWITPFNFDYDGYALIYKKKYNLLIIDYFRSVANKYEADFSIDRFKSNESRSD